MYGAFHSFKVNHICMSHVGSVSFHRRQDDPTIHLSTSIGLTDVEFPRCQKPYHPSSVQVVLISLFSAGWVYGVASDVDMHRY